MGERAGGHRRFVGSQLARPRTAPHRSPSRGSTLQLLDAAMGATPPPGGRRLRQRAAPPGSAMTPPHEHGRSRRRRAWRPPRGRGRQHLKQDREHDRLQLVNYRTGRPIPHRRAGPRHRMPLGRHLPTAPGQRSRGRLRATRCKRSTLLPCARRSARRPAVPWRWPARHAQAAGRRLVQAAAASRSTSASDSTRS
jgi:hypothetical protein